MVRGVFFRDAARADVEGLRAAVGTFGGLCAARFHLTERETDDFDAVGGGQVGGLKVERDGKAVGKTLGVFGEFRPFARAAEELAGVLILNDVAHGSMFVRQRLRSIREVT
jgi:hypothetical protein